MVANYTDFLGAADLMDAGAAVRRSVWPSGARVEHCDGISLLFLNGAEAVAVMWSPSAEDFAAKDWQRE